MHVGNAFFQKMTVVSDRLFQNKCFLNSIKSQEKVGFHGIYVREELPLG